MKFSADKTIPIDKEIREAEVPADMPAPPRMAEVSELRRERDIWLVASADTHMFPSPVLAKAAGFRTMSGYRQALHRARARFGDLDG